MTMKLANKILLITGDTSGIGLEAVKRWCMELWLLKTAFGFCVTSMPVQTAMRNCTRDEGGPFEVGNQVLTSSHRKLLSSIAMVVNVAETSRLDPGRHD
jgi:hypothetical protein